MKVKLSKYWWNNLYGLTVIYILFVAMDLYYINKATKYHLFDYEDNMLVKYILFIAPIFFAIVYLDTAVVMPRKFLRIISIEKDKFISTFFGRYKCEVSRNQPIYYAIFDCKESNFGGVKKFFAVSNEKFVYEVRKPNWRSENRFIDYYDSTKQIIFPYNQETESLIDYDRWIQVN